MAGNPLVNFGLGCSGWSEQVAGELLAPMKAREASADVRILQGSAEGFSTFASVFSPQFASWSHCLPPLPLQGFWRDFICDMMNLLIGSLLEREGVQCATFAFLEG